MQTQHDGGQRQWQQVINQAEGEQRAKQVGGRQLALEHE